MKIKRCVAGAMAIASFPLLMMGVASAALGSSVTVKYTFYAVD
jgi:hypothetical protein